MNVSDQKITVNFTTLESNAILYFDNLFGNSRS